MGFGKKLLALGGVLLAGTAVALLASRNGEDEFSYSGKWLNGASDDELNTEREKVRQAYCSSGDDFDRACNLQNTLYRFDKELSKRAWGDEKPKAPSIHREHGWYLPNDD